MTTVKPKSVTGTHSGQRYILTFNPNAKVDSERWNYEVIITRTYNYYGSASSEQRAANKAKAEIDKLEGNRKIV